MKILIHLIIYCALYTTHKEIGMYNKEDLLHSSIKNDTSSTSYSGYENISYNDLIFHNFSLEVPNFNLLRHDFMNIGIYSNNPQSIGKNSFINVDQSIKNTKTDETSQDCIIDILDKIETVFIPEELNNSELQVLDLKEVDAFFENERSNKITNLFEDFNKTDHNSFEIENNVNTDCVYNINLVNKYDIKLKQFMSKVHNAIIVFLSCNLSSYYHGFYSKRLEKMERCFIYFKNIPSKFYCDFELSEALNRLHSNLKNIKTFNEKTYNKFSRNLDFEILDLKNANLFKGIFGGLSINYGVFNFYFEMMKLHKYINEIPELLTLWGLFLEKSFCDISFILHLINLFIENIGNPRENKFFIICMIYKIFLFSHKKCLDLFIPPKYKLLCRKTHLNNIYFFLWEVESSKRVCMRRKMKGRKILRFSYVEMAHFKVIILVHLHQHVDFLIYYNFNVEIIENFIKFVAKVLNSSDCVVCLLDEFLELAEKHINTLKEM